MNALVDAALIDGSPHLQLEPIDPNAARAVTELLRALPERAQWRLGEQHLQLQWSEPRLDDVRIALELRAGAHTLLLAFDSLATFDPLLVGAPFSRLPAPMRTRTLHRWLARALDSLPAALRESADLTHVAWDTPIAAARWPCRIAFELSRAGGSSSHCIVAATNAAAFDWLRSVLPANAEHATLRTTLAIPVRAVVGETLLPVRSIESLECGDVVWIATARHTRRGISIRLTTHDGRLAWRGDLKRNDFRLLEREPADALALSQHCGGSAMDPDYRATMREIEIPVTFDLGELAIALKDLERMQPGELLELPQAAESTTVHLRVAGQVIAAGRLVAVGRKLGVRMTDVGAMRETSSTAITDA
jgi:type III secretion system YscQ/HrcQ family protein